jgi:hypothetical protein
MFHNLKKSIVKKGWKSFTRSSLLEYAIVTEFQTTEAYSRSDLTKEI